MQRLGIVVAMDVEADPIIRSNNLTREEIHGFYFYSAPNFVIIIAGLTGNLYHQRSIFSINKIYKRDVNFTALGYEPYHFPDKPSFIQLVTDTRLPILDCYTSDEYIGPQSLVPKNVLVDMEGYCVANVCERYGIPCMIYKSISDNTCDNDTQGQIDTHLADAISAICDFIIYNVME